jgi:hypothetical protein
MTPPAAAAAPARARTLTPGRAPTTAPRSPRRVSGPARRETATPRRRAELDGGGLVLGALAALHRLSSHRAVDRLIRGRTWIFIVTFALIGIVTLQLGLLKLNAGIGRSLERGAVLQTENAALSVENSELAAGNRVEATATRLGMELVPAGSLKFLSVGGHGELGQAAAALATPPHGVGPGQSSSEGESSSERPASSESEAAPTSEASAPAARSSESGASEAPPVSPTAATSESSETSASSSSSSSSGSAAGAARAEEGPTPSGGEAAAGGGTQSGPAG